MTRRPHGPTLGIVLGVVLGSALAGCIVQRQTTPRLTGTCDGACDHYLACKPGHSDADRTRCASECPDVFRDPDSLMGYESLSCHDAVEYIDGTARRAPAST
jgi:hypothetical protein